MAAWCFYWREEGRSSDSRELTRALSGENGNAGREEENMRAELFLAIAMLSVILAGWCMRLLSRRDIWIHLLFMLAVISYLASHFTGSRTT